MRRALTLALLLAAALIVHARAEAPTAPSLRSPLPFDHATHAPGFAKEGVTCVDCHPVGMRPEGPLPDPPVASCHGCHLGELPGAPRQASRECAQCHADTRDLLPASHGPDWLAEHGAEARARGTSCTDCHATSACVDCHEARGAGQRTPHPPGFRTTHGLEARLDPMQCSTCHVSSSCQACHTSGAVPW